MENQTIENQARLYLYDPMNEAKEHGFKTYDQWYLRIATEADKKRLQREYYPAIACKVLPEFILDVFQTIKMRLQQSLSKEEQQMDIAVILSSELNYIVAINPQRLR